MQPAPLVSIQGLSKQYGSFTALSEINLTIQKGEIFGLLGPNGAGKTTLIRILTQIYLHDKGDIFFDGELLHAKHLPRIGYLPEERGLYKKMYVHEHLMYLGKLHGLSKKTLELAISSWLEKFNLSDRKKSLIGELSKGNQQKIQFIAALLHDPDFIILDEPFSGFDPLNAELLKQELLQQNRLGKTILYSTHRMESVEELCNNIALINQSRCLYSGSLVDLKQQHKKDSLLLTLKGDVRQKVEGNSQLNKENNTLVTVKLNVTNRKQIIEAYNQQFEILHLEEHRESLHDIFLKLVQ